jgi:hypothetical protein
VEVAIDEVAPTTSCCTRWRGRPGRHGREPGGDRRIGAHREPLPVTIHRGGNVRSGTASGAASPAPRLRLRAPRAVRRPEAEARAPFVGSPTGTHLLPARDMRRRSRGRSRGPRGRSRSSSPQPPSLSGGADRADVRLRGCARRCRRQGRRHDRALGEVRWCSSTRRGTITLGHPELDRVVSTNGWRRGDAPAGRVADQLSPTRSRRRSSWAEERDVALRFR